jgi:hypothetical protein
VIRIGILRDEKTCRALPTVDAFCTIGVNVRRVGAADCKVMMLEAKWTASDCEVMMLKVVKD